MYKGKTGLDNFKLIKEATYKTKWQTALTLVFVSINTVAIKIIQFTCSFELSHIINTDLFN